MSHKAHLAGIIEAVANNMQIVEPTKNEALGLLGAMPQEHNPANMREKMGIINNMIEECQAHITGFKLGAFKEAGALLKNV